MVLLKRARKPMFGKMPKLQSHRVSAATGARNRSTCPLAISLVPCIITNPNNLFNPLCRTSINILSPRMIASMPFHCNRNPGIAVTASSRKKGTWTGPRTRNVEGTSAISPCSWTCLEISASTAEKRGAKSEVKAVRRERKMLRVKGLSGILIVMTDTSVDGRNEVIGSEVNVVFKLSGLKYSRYRRSAKSSFDIIFLVGVGLESVIHNTKVMRAIRVLAKYMIGSC